MKSKASKENNVLNQTQAILEAVDHIGDGLIIVDASYHFIYVNKIAEHLFKKKQDILKKIKIFDAKLPFKGTIIEKSLRKALKNQEFVRVEWFSKSSNEWLRFRINPVLNGLVISFFIITQRKYEEEKMQYYSSISQSISDAVVGTDTKNLITSWNDAAERLYGWTKEEVIGKNSVSILPTTYPHNTKAEFKHCMKVLGSWKGEVIQKRKGGRSIYIQAATSTVKHDDKIIGYVAVNRDITEEKQIENNLRFLADSMKILSSSLDYKITLNTVAKLAVTHISDWCLIDLFDDSHNLSLVAVAHKDIKKVAWAKELRKKDPVDLNDPTGLPNVLRTGRSEFYPFITDDLLIETSKSKEELNLLRKIGLVSVIIVPVTNSLGKAIGGITIISAESGRIFSETDFQTAEKLAARASLAIENSRLYQSAENEINERKIAEESLRAKDKQLETIIKNIADGITLQDTKGKVIYANNSAAHLCGLNSFEELVRFTTKELVAYVRDRFEIKDEFGKEFPLNFLPGRQALLGQKNPEVIIQFYDKHSGISRWVHIKSRPVLNSRGDIEFTVNIMTDITEQKELENRKDNFISMASHELKTPITSLKIYTQLFEKQLKPKDKEPYTYALKMMNNQITKLSNLIADLLNLSRIQVGKLEFRMDWFDIKQALIEIIEQIQATTTQHSIMLEGDIKGKTFGDKDRIGQVFINLLTNAIKFSPSANKIMVYVSQNDDTISVKVRDYGIGIDKKHMENIFRRFYQVTDNDTSTFPGLGMGLYISQEIIKRHNGVLNVESSKGKGSIFSFTLPKNLSESISSSKKRPKQNIIK